MSKKFRRNIVLLLTIALSCGFMHLLIPAEQYNFERLHIFLFNLCAGGTLLIYTVQGRRKLSRYGRLYATASLLFALCAFFNFYPATIILALLLAMLTEKVRVMHLGRCIPLEMISPSIPVAKKFQHAALLCLSLSLIFSAFAICNEIYLHLFTIKKFTLDTFFLGFSFPLSLISMSMIFALMQAAPNRKFKVMKELSFWTINLGVILFFIFILADLFIAQVIIATTLFITVGLIFYLYFTLGTPSQQKLFLLSGLLFLLSTSVTGILYIFLEFSSYYDPSTALPLRRLHAFTALYGWNLSGLIIATRMKEFPLKLHSKGVISLHWLTVSILCPLGYFWLPAAFIAVACYAFFLYYVFCREGKKDLEMNKLPQGL